MPIWKNNKERIIKRSAHSIERRRNKDVLTRLFILISFCAWGVFFVLLLLFHKAQPEFETLFDRFYHLDIRTTWDLTFVQYLVYAIVLGLMVSFAGLFLSRFRARRKTDYKIHLILLGFLYFLLFFMSWILL